MQFLGPPRVFLEGQVVLGHRAQKALALLAYLAREADRAHPRHVLAALFWPDKPEKQALQDLRQTLARLRTAVGDRGRSRDRGTAQPHLVVDSQSIQFNRESEYRLDVEVFEALVAETETHAHRRLDACPTCVAQLAKAVECYCGEFLATLHPVGSPILDEWLLIQREILQQRACIALQALAGSYLACGQAQTAGQYARRFLHLDPWNEAVQRLLLRALALSAGRNAALQQYGTLKRALATELGVEPEDATLDLVAQIRFGAPADMQPPLPFGPLPRPATPYVRRQAEEARITEYLAGRDQRLITLYGPGGSGKSRLALQVTAAQALLWQDGVCFVPLDGVPSAQGLIDAMATALDLGTDGTSLEVTHLIDFLRPKELLLILDGFEHLVDGASLLGEIVSSAPGVKILTTSRTLLGLPTEWAVEVLGLEVPVELSDTAGRSEDHAALQLFRQSACRVAIDFRLSEENLSDVVRICRRVSGLPLGIELAAAWVRLFPCYQIADEMEQSLDFLQDPDGRATDRHQSLRATFDYSYNLLSETQRAHFRMLSVFRGGFTAGAAQQVCGTDPASLVCLVDRSLLQLSPSRRLDMHPILREYAVEKLAENPVEETATRDQHSRFYLSFIQERERSLKGDCAQDTQHEIYGELGNIREAWRWAVTREEIEDLRSSLAALSRFYDLRGLIREAQTVFAEAGERLLSVAVVVPQRRSLACRLLAEQALFLLHGADYARAMAVAEEAAAHACAIGESLCEATGHYVRGEALWRQGDYLASRTELEQALDGIREVQAMDGPTRPAREVETWVLGSLGAACWINGNREQGRAYLEQALDLAQADNNQRERSKLLTNLGVCQVEQGGYAEAIELFEQSLEIRQKVGDRRGEGITLGNLGNVCLYLGDYAQAKANYERALHIQREISARNDEALSRGNLGLVYHYLGENATARVLCDQGLRIARDTGEQRTVAALCMKLAHALTGLGQFDKAAAAYQESVALRRRQGWANVMMEPLAGLAGVRLAQGDVDRALAHAEEIWDCLQTCSLEGTISPFQVYWTCYRVLDAAQDTRSADCLAEAYRLLQERAGRIANEEMRRSFLQNVQPHREITREYVGLNRSPQM